MCKHWPPHTFIMRNITFERTRSCLQNNSGVFGGRNKLQLGGFWALEKITTRDFWASLNKLQLGGFGGRSQLQLWGFWGSKKTLYILQIRPYLNTNLFRNFVKQIVILSLWNSNYTSGVLGVGTNYNTIFIEYVHPYFLFWEIRF